MKVHDPDNMKKKSSSSSMTGTSALEWGGHLLMGDGGPDGVGMEDDGSEPQQPKIIKKKRNDIPAEEKKICLWVLEDGTACGKTFTKFDSLKRHVSEAHKGVRPFACSLCGKNYGRRDYLLRHLKSHNESDVAGIAASPTQNSLGSARLVNSSSQVQVSRIVTSNVQTGLVSTQLDDLAKFTLNNTPFVKASWFNVWAESQLLKSPELMMILLVLTF